MNVLPECPACGYPVRKQACEQREGCPLPDAMFTRIAFHPYDPNEDIMDILRNGEADVRDAPEDVACHTLFADDALDALQTQIDELLEALRVMTLQRDEWQGQASALKREVSVLRKKLAKVGG